MGDVDEKSLADEMRFVDDWKGETVGFAGEVGRRCKKEDRGAAETKQLWRGRRGRRMLGLKVAICGRRGAMMLALN